MTVIIPQLTQIQAFTMAGMSVRTKNEDEFNSKTARIPHLWAQFFTKQLKGAQQKNPIYGVYHRYASDSSGFYTVTAGIGVTDETKARHLDLINIESGYYLVFEAKGTQPSAIIRSWQTVWNYFNDEPQYQRTYLTDFELYKTPHECAVYIGIK